MLECVRQTESFRSNSDVEHFLHPTARTKTPPTHRNPTSIYLYALRDPFQIFPDNSGQQMWPIGTNNCPHTSSDTPRGGLGGVTFQFHVEGRKLLCVGVWLCFALHGDSLRVSEEFLSAVYGRVYDFGPSDVGNLDVKMIGTFLTLWWNRFPITKYRQTDMLELALRNTNTCAQYQPHNLGPCNKSLQCGKYQAK